MTDLPKVALVSGGTGITGRHIIQLLAEDAEWRVVSVSRRQLDLAGPQPVQQVTSVDLTKKEEVHLALKEAGLGGAATYIFHCAFLDTDSATEDCAVNVGMLRNLVEAAEAEGAAVQHVYCMEGTKWYGQQFLAPLKTPYKEDDPRHLPANFYFDQQDYMEGRVRDGAPWSWSALRPNPVCGFSTGSFMNLSVSIAVYASICSELGLAFRFTGMDTAFNALNEVCDARLLAEGMVWTSTQSQCRNQAYNISNGDVFRWSELWPRIGKFFGLAEARPLCMNLVEMMADKEELWARIVAEHNLQDVPLHKLATFKFMDFVFQQPCDWVSDLTKLRKTGFHGMCVSTEEMFVQQFESMRAAKAIP